MVTKRREEEGAPCLDSGSRSAHTPSPAAVWDNLDATSAPEPEPAGAMGASCGAPEHLRHAGSPDAPDDVTLAAKAAERNAAASLMSATSPGDADAEPRALEPERFALMERAQKSAVDEAARDFRRRQMCAGGPPRAMRAAHPSPWQRGSRTACTPALVLPRAATWRPTQASRRRRTPSASTGPATSGPTRRAASEHPFVKEGISTNEGGCAKPPCDPRRGSGAKSMTRWSRQRRTPTSRSTPSGRSSSSARWWTTARPRRRCPIRRALPIADGRG